MKKFIRNISKILILLPLFFLLVQAKATFAQQTATTCFTTNVGNPQGAPVYPAECGTPESVGSSGKVPLYKQWDPRWARNSYGGCGTMASSACGPTALAMVISYWTNKAVLPPETAQKSVSNGWRVCGAGTAYQAMLSMPTMYGLTSKQIGWTEAKRYLQQGVPIIQVHDGGYFTRNGHYIVVTGINADGTYSINDPDGFHRTKATEGQILSSLHLSWVIQK